MQQYYLATPTGFRDITSDEALARERITFEVQQLFARKGFAPIETPTLEIMDVMQAGGRIPQSPFKFYDSRGDLLALRPDVTMQVARMCATRFPDVNQPLRLRYTQRVFRETQMQTSARELTQIGVECIGVEGAETDAALVELFAEALLVAGVKKPTLALATVSVLWALLDKCSAPENWKHAVLEAYHASDFVELNLLASTPVLNERCPNCDPSYPQAIAQLPSIRGGNEAIEAVRALVEPLGCAADLDEFECVYKRVAQLNVRVLVDFSIMSSFDYYTGIVFCAFAPHVGVALGSGGRYDCMMAAYGPARPAAGFAFYLERAMEGAESALASPIRQRPLRIAVPKGSLAPDTLAALAACGLETEQLAHAGRHLVINAGEVEYIIVRPSDAPVFVALGAADCGICGKDSLVESNVDVVELVDLKFGACRFVVAQPADNAESSAETSEKRGGVLRVATKYPHITRKFYAKQGIQVEIVELHGNIELAPLTGLSERIVDITATGTTLRENNLRIVEEVMSSTARFFVNPAAFRTDTRVSALAEALKRQAESAHYNPIAGASQSLEEQA